MRKDPAGTATISGQLAPSLKVSRGRSPHSSAAVSGFAARAVGNATVAAPQGAGGAAGLGSTAGAAADPAAGGAGATGGATAAVLLLRASIRARASPAKAQ